MKILRLRQVLDLTGLSRSTLYQYMQNQQFTIQVRLWPNIVGWVEDEVVDWIRGEEESNSEIPGRTRFCVIAHCPCAQTYAAIAGARCTLGLKFRRACHRS